MSHNYIINKHYNKLCTYSNVGNDNYSYGNYIGNNIANNTSLQVPIYGTIIFILIEIPYINHNMQYHVRRHLKGEVEGINIITIIKTYTMLLIV